jgi:hypothetical protein
MAEIVGVIPEHLIVVGVDGDDRGVRPGVAVAVGDGDQHRLGDLDRRGRAAGDRAIVAVEVRAREARTERVGVGIEGQRHLRLVVRRPVAYGVAVGIERDDVLAGNRVAVAVEDGDGDVGGER